MPKLSDHIDHLIMNTKGLGVDSLVGEVNPQSHQGYLFFIILKTDINVG